MGTASFKNREYGHTGQGSSYLWRGAPGVKTGGSYPVILFSRGFGGNKDAFGPIGQHWASHGCVVIHPTHADGVGRREAEPLQGGGDDTAPRPRPGGLVAGSRGSPSRAGLLSSSR